LSYLIARGRGSCCVLRLLVRGPTFPRQGSTLIGLAPSERAPWTNSAKQKRCIWVPPMTDGRLGGANCLHLCRLLDALKATLNSYIW